jgi:hypothetical protein
MNRICVLLLAGIMFLSGCASAPVKDIRVEAEADPKTNFGGYKTYAWLGAAAILNDPDPHGQWEPPEFDADAEIKYLIDRELRKRGMMPSYTDPDLLVAFAAGIDMEALKLKVDPETKIDVPEKVPSGGLVVLFVDGQSGSVNWVLCSNPDVQEAAQIIRP